MNDRYTPPAMTPTLVLGLSPPLELPLEVGEGIGDVPITELGTSAMPVSRLVPEGVSEGVKEVVLERETTGGALGVASGSLPAAFARVTSNELSYTRPVRQIRRSGGRVRLRYSSRTSSAGLRRCTECQRGI